jgi:hypothetical protein
MNPPCSISRVRFCLVIGSKYTEEKLSKVVIYIAKYNELKNHPDFKEKCRLRGKLQYLKKKDDPATKEKKRHYNKLYRERKLLEKQQNEPNQIETA